MEILTLPGNEAVRYKLFLMMVLEFFIWGAWLPFIFSYLPSLGFTPGQQALDSECFSGGGDHWHVFQQSIRGPEFCRAKNFWDSAN